MVYVDEAWVCLRSKKWPYKRAAHLTADSVNELHSFAKKIGLRRAWFQSKTIPHYDVTVGMRQKAIRLGAVPITMKKMVERIREYRKREKGRGE